MSEVPLSRKRVNLLANGKLRSLLTIEENKNGNVYIRIKSGTQVGMPPNEVAVVQDRYSIHPSLKSPTYTTLKSTLELANGFKRTSVALTDAVKVKSGFGHLFSHRSSDLTAPIYDLTDIGNPNEALCLREFDPKQRCLVFAVFVGHPNADFGPGSGNEIISTFVIGQFRLVIAHCWITMPALPFAWTMNTLTFSPESFEGEVGKEAAYAKMMGTVPSGRLELFHGLAGELTVNLLETYMSFAVDPDVRNRIQEKVEAVPRIASIRV